MRSLIQRRRSSKDIRAYSVKLTDEGRRVLRAAMPVAAGVDRSVLTVLPSARRDVFLISLASIVRTLERAASADGKQ